VRRLIVHASEDIGLADPMALVQATAAAQAVEHVGLPEARLNLAQATIYLARAPKSNSVYTALAAAQEDALGAEPVPSHLRDASYGGARALGHGKGYIYPHDRPGHWVEQAYRPEGYEDHRYFEPSDMGDDVSDWTPGAGPPRDEPGGGVG
jgi:putative ATPase